MKRSAKLYWYDSEPIPKIQVQPEAKSERIELGITKPDYSVPVEMIIPIQTMPIHSEIPVNQMIPFPKNTVKPEPRKHSDKQPKRSVRFYKQPLPDSAGEWLAQKVYLATGNLQEVEARQLVDKYGRKAVGQALGRMEYMREKGELQNSAGFMKVVSRVSWFAINGFDTPRPEYQPSKNVNRAKLLTIPKMTLFGNQRLTVTGARRLSKSAVKPLN